MAWIAFDRELPCQVEPRGAHRDADGQLGPASVGSNERERHEIGECGGQYHNDRGEQKQHGLAKIADKYVLERRHLHRLLPGVLDRKPLPERTADRGQLRLCLPGIRPAVQSANESEKVDRVP